jgi:hypothetical protein
MCIARRDLRMRSCANVRLHFGSVWWCRYPRASNTHSSSLSSNSMVFSWNSSSSPPLLQPMPSMALINTRSERIRFFFFTSSQQKYVALIFVSCSLRSRETGVPPDGQKEIFIWSSCWDSGTYSPGFFRPHQDRFTCWWWYYILECRDALFCRGGLWIRNKRSEHGGKEREGGIRVPRRDSSNSKGKQRGLREKRESRGECTKYNVTERLPNAEPLGWSLMHGSFDDQLAVLRFDYNFSLQLILN